jgi:hypothetical protein
VIPASSFAVAEAIQGPLDALLAEVMKDESAFDRRAPEESTAVRRSGTWLRKSVLALLGATRLPRSAAPQNGQPAAGDGLPAASAASDQSAT